MTTYADFCTEMAAGLSVVGVTWSKHQEPGLGTSQRPENISARR